MPPRPVERVPALSGRWASVLVILAALGLAGAAGAQTASSITIQRDDSTIVLTNYGTGEQGARSILRNSFCEEGVEATYFYGPPDQVELIIDEDTRLVSSLAIVRQAGGRDGNGEQDREGQETIELLDATATFSGRPTCLEEYEAADPANVLLEQGRTTVVGSRFFLDRDTDVALMDGPVELVRAAEGDSDELTATSESLSYHLETNRSTLTGGVRVESGDRVSRAETLELDEEAGLATLTGSPAVSRQGEDEIQGETLLYYLDSNDVVVTGGVSGQLEVDLD